MKISYGIFKSVYAAIFPKKNVTFVVATTNIANMVIWAVLDM